MLRLTSTARRLPLPRPAPVPRERLQGFSAMSMAQPMSLDEFDVDFRSPIGSGSFGSVHPGQHRITGTQVAIKTVIPACLPADGRIGRTELVEGVGLEQRLFNQVLLEDISHPHVVDLVGCFDGSAEEADMLGLDVPNAAFDEPLHHFVMELLEGESLQSHVEQSKGLQESEAAKITHVLCQGLEFLHDNGIVHRDIKPSNVHYSHRGGDVTSLKFIDFSTAGLVQPGVPIDIAVFDEIVGTPGYVAPEVLTAQKNGTTYNSKCDMFSLGCSVYAMLFNMYLPRRHQRLGVILDQGLIDTLSPEGRDFVKALLSLNPADRPTVSEALHHPWLQQNVE